MTGGSPHRDLTRTVLAVLFLGGLLGLSFWILRPFLGPLIWATLLVVASWPLMTQLQQRLGGRRNVAAAIMVVVMVLAIIVPFSLLISVLVQNAPGIVAWAKSLPAQAPDHLPDWVRDVPGIGPHAAAAWDEWMSEGPQSLGARLSPYLDELLRWATGQIGGAGLLFLNGLLILLLVVILYLHGEVYAAGVLGFARRLAGDRGDRAMLLAVGAIRGVALGVVATALVQAVAGGVGLAVAGVPVPGLLTAVMFVSGIAQVGAAPVILCSALWLFFRDETGWAIGLGIWALLVGSLDNVLRPLLIRKGVNLPMLLIFAGVIGGLFAFGIIGLFVGPVVLAVGYTLLTAWIADAPDA